MTGLLEDTMPPFDLNTSYEDEEWQTKESKKRKLTQNENQEPQTQAEPSGKSNSPGVAEQTPQVLKGLSWHAVLSSNKPMKQSLMSEAMARYCPRVIIVNEKLTQTKLSLFLKFDIQCLGFNKLFSQLKEIGSATGTELKLTPWSAEPPRRAREPQSGSSSSHCVARNVPEDYSEKYILDKLSPELKANVTRVGRIITGTEGKPTSFVRIVCKSTETAKSLIDNGLVLNNRRFSVVEAKQQTRPLQCYNCQAFGHHSVTCQNQMSCGKCGLEHMTKSCTYDRSEKVHCTNCKGDHPSYSNKCTFFQRALVEKKEKKKAQEQRSQATVNQISTAVGKASFAHMVNQHSSQTRADIAQISTATQAETAKVLKENVLNIKQSISNSLGDMKAFIQATIKQEVKLAIESIRNEIKTEIEKAFADIKSMINRDIQESITETIADGMVQTFEANPQPVSLDGAKRASMGSDPKPDSAKKDRRSNHKSMHSMPGQIPNKQTQRLAAKANPLRNSKTPKAPKTPPQFSPVYD